jgi:hypothetical protein
MASPVECHSGYDYAERPIAFIWAGERFEVETIMSEWRTPENKGFRVRVVDGLIFELVYHQVSDTWEVTAI